MFSLKFVIGQVVDTIRTAGPVVLVQDFLIGGSNNTVGQVPQPVAQESKPKRKAVKQATQEQSPTVETSPVRIRTKKSSTTGMSRTQVAPQSAKQPQKSKPKVALKATKASSQASGKKSAPKTTGRTGK